MRQAWQRSGWWVLAWCVVSAAGALAFARQELQRQHEGFETDARIAHRLLSQRVVQHEAVLATLALLQPTGAAADGVPPEQRLPSLYPQILAVQRRDRDAAWTDERLRAAEAASRAQRGAALASVDFAQGRYMLVRAADPASFALSIDLRSMVPWSEWPMDAETSPVRLTLEHAGQRFVLQPGRATAPQGGWRFDVRKTLAAPSQPFELAATREVGWAELPWGRIGAWAALVAAALAALRQWQRQRVARRRAEDLLRLGQVARLNTLGELAAGMAHELNQPLTAVLANTQAARRLLAEETPALDTARQAMGQAEAQARRASDVVGRLRRVVERPGLGSQAQAVNLAEAVRRALHLLEPECRRRGVAPELDAPAPVRVQAEPVALDQIIHNLLMNALQALEQVPPAERRLRLDLRVRGPQGELAVADSGPGIPAELLPRIFEPFFSTRQGGLGLGLSLSETLATNLGGTLTAQANPPRGALFQLRLPLAPGPA